MVTRSLEKALEASLKQLEVEFEKIDRKAREITQRRASLEALISAQRSYLQSLRGSQMPAQHGMGAVGKVQSGIDEPLRGRRSSPLGDGCLNVLVESGKPMRLGEIWSALQNRGIKTGSKSNVWFALRRLVRKELVTKPKGGLFQISPKVKGGK